MIIYRDNIDPDKEILDILSDDEFNKRFYHEESNIITTFHNHDNYKDLNKLSNDFYSVIVEKMMKKFSLYEISRYSWKGWYQSYFSFTEGHSPHTHMGFHELFSFVHFLSVPEKPCFYFLIDDKKQYINEKNGDFVIFPSWAIHGVDSISTGERKVFSGNVSYSFIKLTETMFLNTELISDNHCILRINEV